MNLVYVGVVKNIKNVVALRLFNYFKTLETTLVMGSFNFFKILKCVSNPKILYIKIVGIFPTIFLLI